MQADRHPNEAARLAALKSYGILDTAEEAEFDEIVRVVSEICDMPMTLISLVDTDRQWFKARVGIDATQTPFHTSVCAHGILQPDLLEIADMTKDVRTIDNPLVVGDPNARFYAGAALTNDEGHPLGMLCVLDTKPRSLTPAQRNLLQVMAKMVMRQIELRKTARAERAAHAQLQDILDKANALLERNDMLRREIDHRVKNSLAQIAAFLRLQERRHTGEPRIAEPLAEARNRVMTVVNIHDHLHRAAEDDQTQVLEFLKNLVESVTSNCPPQVSAINVTGDMVRMSSDKVMALGLAVNELVSNAMKYAFPRDHKGIIDISFRTEGANHVLRIRDNGRGLPESFNLRSTSGLGMRVLNSLTQQLRGTFSYANDPGASFELRFPVA